MTIDNEFFLQAQGAAQQDEHELPPAHHSRVHMDMELACYAAVMPGMMVRQGLTPKEAELWAVESVEPMLANGDVSQDAIVHAVYLAESNGLGRLSQTMLEYLDSDYHWHGGQAALDGQLMHGVGAGNGSLVKEALDNGAMASHGNSAALRAAVISGHMPIAEMLVRGGAKISQALCQQDLRRMWAGGSAGQEVLGWVQGRDDAGAITEERWHAGRTGVCRAMDLRRTLLAHEYDEAEDVLARGGLSPEVLEYALWRSVSEGNSMGAVMVDKALCAVSPKRCLRAMRAGELSKAAVRNDVNSIEVLVRAGADASYMDGYALRMAVICANIEAAKTIHAMGVDAVGLVRDADVRNLWRARTDKCRAMAEWIEGVRNGAPPALAFDPTQR